VILNHKNIGDNWKKQFKITKFFFLKKGKGFVQNNKAKKSREITWLITILM